MIKAVVFDMFETLITHYNSPLYFGWQMAEDAGISEENYLRLWRGMEADRTIGNLSLEQALKKILISEGAYSEAVIDKIVTKRRMTCQSCFENLHAQIVPMLDSLKKEGFLIGLISNCFSEEADVIRHSALFPYFDAVCLSYEIGVKKPEPAIYQMCTELLGVAPDDCVFVGDGGSNELYAAKEFGMKPLQAVWYLKEGTYQPTGRIPEFIQLETPLDLLKYLK